MARDFGPPPGAFCPEHTKIVGTLGEIKGTLEHQNRDLAYIRDKLDLVCDRAALTAGSLARPAAAGAGAGGIMIAAFELGKWILHRGGQ